MTNSQIQKYLSAIRDVPDFPKEGVIFKDIAPLLQNSQLIDQLISDWSQMLDFSKFDLIGGIESRGFIFGSMLAIKNAKGFVPIRKAGKLPPPVQRQDYALEYGTAAIEMPAGSGRMLIVDDVLATGGTLAAAQDLAGKSGYAVEGLSVFIDLQFLNNLRFRGSAIPSVIQYK